MKRKISEIDYGTDVWMYLPHYSEVHPILVTIESDVTDGKFLMPRKRYSLKNESDMFEGVKGLCQLLNGEGNIAFANQDCWDNKDEAQEYIDSVIEERKKNLERLKEKYKEKALEHIQSNHYTLSGDDLMNYIDGFVACAMYMRENKHLLDI